MIERITKGILAMFDRKKKKFVNSAAVPALVAMCLRLTRARISITQSQHTTMSSNVPLLLPQPCVSELDRYKQKPLPIELKRITGLSGSPPLRDGCATFYPVRDGVQHLMPRDDGGHDFLATSTSIA